MFRFREILLLVIIVLLLVDIFSYQHVKRYGGQALEVVKKRVPKSRLGLRLAIITYYSDNEMGRELRSMTWKNKQDYARKHGYDIYDLNLVPGMPERIKGQEERMKYNFFFFKAYGILELLEGRFAEGSQYDWIVWQDADSFFLNWGKGYEPLLDPQYDVLITAGPPDMPQWTDVINAGSFIVRNSDFTRQFLKDILEMSEHGCHELLKLHPEMREKPHNGWLNTCSPDGEGYWLSDQGLMMALYLWKEGYGCHFKRLWFQAMHSEFPWYSNGDLAVHLPGKPNSERRRLIKAFNKYANYETGTVDLTHTDLLDPSDCFGHDLAAMDKLYAPLNQPCK